MQAKEIIRDLLRGRAQVSPDLKVHLTARDGAALQDKFRQAY